MFFSTTQCGLKVVDSSQSILGWKVLEMRWGRNFSNFMIRKFLRKIILKNKKFYFLKAQNRVVATIQFLFFKRLLKSQSDARIISIIQNKKDNKSASTWNGQFGIVWNSVIFFSLFGNFFFFKVKYSPGQSSHCLEFPFYVLLIGKEKEKKEMKRKKRKEMKRKKRVLTVEINKGRRNAFKS